MTTLTVRRNDTLGRLVSQYNKTHKNKVSVAQVAKQNKLKDPDKIQVGQRLKIADGFETRKTTKPVSKPQVKQPEQKQSEPVKTTPVQTEPQRPAEPAKQAKEPKGWLEWLLTYKPFGDNN